MENRPGQYRPEPEANQPEQGNAESNQEDFAKLSWYRKKKAIRAMRKQLLYRDISKHIYSNTGETQISRDEPFPLSQNDSRYNIEKFYKRGKRRIKAILRDLKKNGQPTYDEAKTRFDTYVASCERVNITTFRWKDSYSPSTNGVGLIDYYDVTESSIPFIPTRWQKKPPNRVIAS